MRRTFWVLVAVVLAAFLLSAGTAEADNSIAAPDMGFSVGQHASMVLDGSGYPVISYYDAANGDLKVVHCGNADCTAVDSIASPDTGGDVGQYSSLVLDASGYPVVSYHDVTNNGLKVLHCGNANCTAGNTIYEPDWLGPTGQGAYTSLALDSSGNPVISYYDPRDHGLKILHCQSADCAGGLIMAYPDLAGTVGTYTSLVLDGSGNPVVSYYDVGNGDLKVLHCGDADCLLGNTITSPDGASTDAGRYTSLALDGSGYPVVSYYDVTLGNLKVMHCNDANCTGGNESIRSPDDAGNVGWYTSLVLDGSGYPVVSYYDVTNGDLKVLHCSNANCTLLPEYTSPDTVGIVGQYTSLALDGSGWPVVSYYDYVKGTLEVLHCGSAGCTGSNAIATADPGGDVGAHTSLRLDGGGNPVVSYYDVGNFDLKVLHCGNANCTSGNSITSPDTAGDVGADTSLALDGSGRPVVSYFDTGNQDLKVLHCGNAACTSGNSITSPDTGGDVGWYTSLALDSSGNPVVSYGDVGNLDLKVMHCNDPNCAGGDESIASPDTAGDVGRHTWLALDGNIPVVSYYDATNADLKVLRCGNADCTSGNSITSPDTAGDVGTNTSLVLDSSGRPVVSYYDYNNGDLKVLHCGNANCTSGNSITAPETAVAGFYLLTSLKLDAAGNPVVSYINQIDQDLKVLHCNDPNCDPAVNGAESITSPDTAGSVGWDSSLALNPGGNPVVSYRDMTNGDLKVLHCDDKNCATLSYPPAGTDRFDVQFTALNIRLDGVDKGPFVGNGYATVVRGAPYVGGGGKECVDYDIESMHLEGTLDGVPVDIDAGEGITVPVSSGTICEGDATLTLYIEETDEGVGLAGDGLSVAQTGNHFCNCCTDCGLVTERWSSIDCTAVISEVPPDQVTYYCGEDYPLCDCETDDERVRVDNPDSGGLLLAGVGGIADWPGTTAGPDSRADSPAGSGFNYVVLGVALAAAAAVVAALAAGVWVARRRWAR